MGNIETTRNVGTDVGAPGTTWNVVRAGIALALAGSIWSLAADATCGACQEVASLAGGHSLALIGVAGYTALSIALHFFRERAWPVWLVLAAGGAHLALLGQLYAHRSACPPCLTTAAGALIATGALIVLDDRNLKRALIMLPLAAIAANLALYTVNRMGPPVYVQPELVKALDVAGERGPVAAGEVRLTWFTRPRCKYCRKFEKSMLPVVEQRYGEKLAVCRKEAWNGLPTPTVIVEGTERILFFQLPRESALIDAIEQALAPPQAWDGSKP